MGSISTYASARAALIDRWWVRNFTPRRVEQPIAKGQLRHDLRAMTWDGATFSVMVGAGETYLPAFVLALGMGEVFAGMIATVPMLAGGLLQMSSPAGVRLLGSHKRWVVTCAFVQAASFVPFFLAALTGWMPTPVAFLVAAVYWGAGLGTGAAWNTWVDTIVPGRVRVRFFARRTRWSQLGVLLGFVGGGIALQLGAAFGRPLNAFAILFAVAAACRFVSASFLAIQSEPIPLPNDHRGVTLSEFATRVRRASDGQLILYLAAVQLAVQLSGPYFTPFMLKQLHFSYAQYLCLLAVAFLAKIAVLPGLAHLARRHGPRKLLWIGGLGIIPLPAMWMVSTSYPYLVATQIASGAVWAAYELAMFLLFFEAIPPRERTSMLTIYNLAQASAQAAGALLGGLLLRSLGTDTGAYLALFAASSLARIGTVVILARIPELAKEVVPLATRVLAIRPSAGSIDRPILPSLPKADDARDDAA